MPGTLLHLRQWRRVGIRYGAEITLPDRSSLTVCLVVQSSKALPRLVIVSNRVSLPDATGKGTAGGLGVALREAFRSYQGLWFGWSGKITAQSRSQPIIIDKGDVQYVLIDLTSIDRQEYYRGFANRAL
jgi:trehalose-6-phosphate synthase